MPTKLKKLLSPGVCVCIAVVFICLIGGVISVVSPRTKHSTDIFTVTDLSPLAQIEPDDVIEQRFTVDEDYDSFGLYFANYSRPVHQGKLVVTIQPEGGLPQPSNARSAVYWTITLLILTIISAPGSNIFLSFAPQTRTHPSLFSLAHPIKTLLHSQ